MKQYFLKGCRRALSPAILHVFSFVAVMIFCGSALADGFIALKSYNYPTHYVRHRNYLGEITPLTSQLDHDDSSFRMVPGLAGSDTVSFESKNYPGYYLRHQNFRIKLQRPDGSDLFRKDASFRSVPGLADSSWKSFESVNYPGYYLRHRNFLLYLEQGQGDLYRKDTTFWIVGDAEPQGNADAGTPSDSREFVGLKSYNYPSHYIRHRNYLGEITPLKSQLDFDDSSFRMVSGLAGGDTVSFESKNYPGYYLRHQNFRIKLQRLDGSDLFRNDASFREVPGLADSSWKSFESVNYPGYYLRHRNFQLFLEQGSGDLFRKDCTFKIVGGSSSASRPDSSSKLTGELMSLRSYNYPDYFIRHRNYLGEITPLNSRLDFDDAAFKIRKGLAGTNTVSFESKNYPGFYLRHQNFRIKLQRMDGSDLFKKDASFKLIPGLADASWYSFESVNYPGYFLRHRNFQLFLEQGSGDLFNKDCSFRVERAK